MKAKLLLLALATVICFTTCHSNNVGSEANSNGSDTSDSSDSSVKLPEMMMPGPIDPIWDDGDFFAIAHLGPFATIGQLRSNPLYQVMLSCYPGLDDINKIAVNTGSGDLWLVVPRSDQVSIAVNEYNLDFFLGTKDEDDATIYYKTESGEPFLMRMTADDPGSVKIVAVNGGHVLEWIPTQDPHSNELRMADGVWNITRDIRFCEYGMDYEGQTPAGKVPLRFYADGQLMFSDGLGRYCAFHLAKSPAGTVGIGLYYTAPDGRSGYAELQSYDQDGKTFTIIPKQGLVWGSKDKPVKFTGVE